MTKEERQILINQYLIMKHLNIDDLGDQKDLDVKIDILMNGWSWLYDDEILNVSNDCDESIQKEVVDILSMYRSIYSSKENFTEDELKSLPNSHFLTFQGFDGNEESYHYHFMNFYINKYGRFEEITAINSHRNVLDQYRTMLEKYEIINKTKTLITGFDLTLDELKEILD